MAAEPVFISRAGHGSPEQVLILVNSPDNGHQEYKNLGFPRVFPGFRQVYPASVAMDQLRAPAVDAARAFV